MAGGGRVLGFKLPAVTTLSCAFFCGVQRKTLVGPGGSGVVSGVDCCNRIGRSRRFLLPLVASQKSSLGFKLVFTARLVS